MQEEPQRDEDSAEEAGPADAPAAEAEASGVTGTETIAPEDEIRDLKDKLIRSYAEIENYKKRAAKDKSEWFKYANEEILREFLAVLDSLNRARGQGDDTPELSKWVDGVALIIKQFEDLLSRFGVKPIEAEGVPFDPSIHQAMAQVDSEKETGTVVDEIQKGYMLHDRVLRPSLVTVAR